MSSKFEDKEMVDQFDANGSKHGVFSERLLKGFMLDNEVASYGNGFSDESCPIHRGNPKLGNEGDVIIDTIHVVDEEESKSSYDSKFLSYATSFYDNTLGNGFKVFDNISYGDDLDDRQPLFVIMSK